MSSVRDVVLASILIFIFGMGFFVINFVTKTFVTNIVTIPAINTSDTQHAVQSFTDMNKSVDRLDYVIFGLFIGLILAIIIAGWYVGGNAIFMFFYFIVTVIGVLMSMVMANVWNDISNASVFGLTVNSFPITNHLLTYLPLYTTFIGIIGMVVMFSKQYVDRGL